MDRVRSAEAEGHEEEGREEEGQQEVVSLTAEQLQKMLESAAASAVEAAFEQQRLQGNKVQEPASVRYVPRRGAPRRQNGMTHYDPDTGEEFDPFVQALMFRSDLVDTCACGKMSWARTQTFVGERDIRDAQRPRVHLQTGEVLGQPWRFVVDPETGQEQLPAALVMTDDKRAHAVECAEAKREAMRGQVHEMLRGNHSTTTFRPITQQEAAAQATYGAIHE